MCDRNTAALLGDFGDLGQTEDLETAAVGQNRTFPAHEVVQAAQLADDFSAGRNAR
jgi:hypothetical protein